MINLKFPIFNAARSAPTLLLALLLSAPPSGAQSLTDQAEEVVRNWMEAGVSDVGVASIRAMPALRSFYEDRVYRPAWIADSGIQPRAIELLRAIRDAGRDGLTPTDYHLEAIEALMGRAGISADVRRARGLDPRTAAELDLLFSDAFLTLGSHLLSGRVDPVTAQPDWVAVRRERNMVQVLQAALSGDSVQLTLGGLTPPQPAYRRLRGALAQYRALAKRGGWPTVPAGPKLEPGASDPRVPELRKRLAASGDLSAEQATESELYDETLEAAVRRFQTRHGLDVDGIVGPGTLAALNVSAGQRARQIELNLERWRWLPEELGRRHILVNAANFELDVVEDGREVLTMRVVVGRPYRKTPVFSDSMTYLVLNPYWHVPHNLAVQDLLPKIKADTAYLRVQGIRVFQAGSTTQIDPNTIDWSAISASSFPYRLRQDPGPLNALGQVKFMFPNAFNVYLHDTPTRGLFAKAARDFSSGCIRLEAPMKLAEYVLRGTSWDAEKIAATLRQGVEQTVKLPQPIPVHLLYWTAWAAADGSIHFRRDIYERDPALQRALKLPPPGQTE